MKKVDNYEEAYAEVVEVLNYIPMSEYKKIPKQYITFMEENSSETCSFVYNIALPFDKQNVSDTAKNILGMIFRLFIIEESKKEELNDKDRELQKKEEIEKYIKYSPDNLFKKNNTNNNFNNEKEKVALVEVKDSVLMKIWKKIKGLFKKRI